MSENRERDDVTGIETTGHEWDGIKELDQPLPQWWKTIFYATIVGSVLAWIWYPSWPVWLGEWTFTAGVSGYTARKDVANELAKVEEERKEYRDRIAGLSLDAIRTDTELLRISLAGGAAAYGDNCAPCHGSGAQGQFGFPNLNDDAWLWGGTLDEIYHTLQHGIRWEDDPDTRYSIMQGFLNDGILSRQETADVTQYVLSLTGRADDAEAAARGGETFAVMCTACHGEDAKGNHDFGAPDLTDAIWLYGGDEETIYETLTYGRAGVMPAWNERLDEATIKQLALFVHSLGGGETRAMEGSGAQP